MFPWGGVAGGTPVTLVPGTLLVGEIVYSRCDISVCTKYTLAIASALLERSSHIYCRMQAVGVHTACVLCAGADDNGGERIADWVRQSR